MDGTIDPIEFAESIAEMEVVCDSAKSSILFLVIIVCVCLLFVVCLCVFALHVVCLFVCLFVCSRFSFCAFISE